MFTLVWIKYIRFWLLSTVGYKLFTFLVAFSDAHCALCFAGGFVGHCLVDSFFYFEMTIYVFLGLLNLEKLLRQFLISKDCLSVRMLDDSWDPTPLLKEIRDDKTSTIIIHANASMSHTILMKVCKLHNFKVLSLTMSQFTQSCTICLFFFCPSMHLSLS